MMNRQKFNATQQTKRKRRVRKKVRGDAQRPRLTVFRSLRHIYAQIIDDEGGFTLAAASTLSDNPGDESKNFGNTVAAAHTGQALARKATALGIRQVRFDRSCYKYHGRVKALAEAARKGGLVF
ncbi:MAG: 50S ribosomal protein L18 [Sedimentisphaerales bacterium]|nr:50S ribosomal protein L18 [Sedimentisphaerales bacterium]